MLRQNRKSESQVTAGVSPQYPDQPQQVSDQQNTKEPTDVPKLGHVRSYHDWDLSETAADALGRIGAPAVPALVQALQSPEPIVRQRAAEVLARIGPEAASAVPYLVRALHDPHEPVQRMAARALGQVGPLASEAVPELLHVLLVPLGSTHSFPSPLQRGPAANKPSYYSRQKNTR